jgi:hypothetical protein
MKGNCWMSPNEVAVHDVPHPSILNDRDAIVRITSAAICGSDLHLLDGYVPTVEEGDVMGHEFIGEVVEVGPGVDASKLRAGDRVVVPLPIACAACRAQLYSCCENSNPNAGIAEKMFGHPVAGVFGYSHHGRLRKPHGATTCSRTRGRLREGGPHAVAPGLVGSDRADGTGAPYPSSMISLIRRASSTSRSVTTPRACVQTRNAVPSSRSSTTA